jgi:hypothetical protein
VVGGPTLRGVSTDRHLLRITCSGCDATWAGPDRAHCGTCHRSFDDISLFDAHRVDDRCVHPAELGLISTRNGIWLTPLASSTGVIQRRRVS